MGKTPQQADGVSNLHGSLLAGINIYSTTIVSAVSMAVRTISSIFSFR